MDNKDSIEKYKILFEGLFDAVFIADAETGIILDANSQAEALIGIPRSRIVGMHQRDLHPPEQRKHCEQEFAVDVALRKSNQTETFILHNDGRKIPVVVTSTLIDFGGHKALAGIFRDISREKWEHESNRFLLDLLNVLNKGEEADRTIVELLRMVKEHFGFEYVGLKLKDEKRFPFFQVRALATDHKEACFIKCECDFDSMVFADNNKTMTIHCMCGATMTGNMNRELPTVTKAGSYWTNGLRELAERYLGYDYKKYAGEYCGKIDFQTVALIPIRDGDEIIGIMQFGDHRPGMASPESIRFMEKIGASIGISIARLRADTAIRNAANEWMATLDGMSEVVIRVGADNKIQRANKAVTGLLGLHYAGIIGSDFTETLGAVDPALVESVCPPDSVEEHPRTCECAAENLGKIFLCSRSRITDDTGVFKGHVYVFEDVTDRKILEDELYKSQKLETVGVLAGGIAHDFNNLLTAIWGNVSMALVEIGRNNEVGEMLVEAEAACKRAAAITKQILTFARGGDPVKRVASVKDVLQESIGFVFSGSKSKCEIFVDDNLLPAEIDPGQIGQALNNILINADQAMPLGGKITIKAENALEQELARIASSELKLKKAVKIVIQDDGLGILPEYLPKIFDPFFTTKHKGRGLGLTAAHRIVAKHGGVINVQSKMGKGTEFIIYLPAAEMRN